MDRRFRLLLASTIFASGSAALSGRMITVAYPVFEIRFIATSIEMQWLMAAPVLAVCSLVLVGGRMGDYFGKRIIFRTGLMAFVVGSGLCAFSVHMWQLIAGQVLMGLGSALGLPACLSLIKQEVAADLHGKAIGMWAGLGGIFGVLGLLVGGLLIERLGWTSIFWASMIPAVIAVIIIPKERHRKVKAGEAKPPVSTAIGIFSGIFLVTLALIFGNQNSWVSVWNYLTTLGSVGALTFLIIRQNRLSAPLIPLKVFRRKLILGANIGTFLIYFSLNGLYTFMVYQLQSFYDYSPTHAGWSMIPASLMVTIFAGRFGKREKHARSFLLLGSALCSVAFAGLYLFSHDNSNYFTHFLPMIILLGLGMALLVSPITNFAMSVSNQYTGLASGVNNLIARFSGLIAIAVIGGIYYSGDPSVGVFKTCLGIMGASVVLATMFLYFLVYLPGKKGMVV